MNASTARTFVLDPAVETEPGTYEPADTFWAVLDGPRRALSCGRWVAELPEINVDGSGSLQTFEYVRGGLRNV